MYKFGSKIVLIETQLKPNIRTENLAENVQIWSQKNTM